MTDADLRDLIRRSLRHEAIEAGITLAEACRRAGVDYQRLGRIFEGRTRDRGEIAKVRDALRAARGGRGGGGAR